MTLSTMCHVATLALKNARIYMWKELIFFDTLFIDLLLTEQKQTNIGNVEHTLLLLSPPRPQLEKERKKKEKKEKKVSTYSMVVDNS